jgi:hypothetical protein
MRGDGYSAIGRASMEGHMPSTSSGDNPGPESARSGDPAATAESAFRSEQGGQPPRSPPLPGAAPISGTSHGNRPLWKKILPALVLAVIGVALLFGAKTLYTSPSELPAPPYSQINLDSTFPVASISYTVDQVSLTIAEIKIEFDLPNAHPPAGAPTADLTFVPPIGTLFRTCPSGRINAAGLPTAPTCLNLQKYGEVWEQPLIFKVQPGIYGAAFADLFVRAQNFGVIFNAVSASAAIPQVNLKSSSGSPSVFTQYNIPSASSYDWATFPTSFDNGSYAVWDEGVSGGVLDCRAAVGINNANEAKENSKTFIAGALLGLGGAALLSALQEALHANDRR